MRVVALPLLLAWSAHTLAEATVTHHQDETAERAPVHTLVPEYPRVARRDRIEGEVQVCFHIDRRGLPYRVAVRKSTHRIFEKPSLRAVKGSAYKPLQPGEKESGIKTCRTFRFELSPDERR